MGRNASACHPTGLAFARLPHALLSLPGVGWINFDPNVAAAKLFGVKQPDVSIFCEAPGPPDHKGAVAVVPQAVVEIVSEGSEIKDFDIGPVFYLSQGVKDVMILDPDSGTVIHHRVKSVQELKSPVTIELECGCVCTV